MKTLREEYSKKDGANIYISEVIEKLQKTV
jgi:hypothetical protein